MHCNHWLVHNWSQVDHVSTHVTLHERSMWRDGGRLLWATESVDPRELLRKRAADADLDFLRDAVAVLVGALMGAEMYA